MTLSTTSLVANPTSKSLHMYMLIAVNSNFFINFAVSAIGILSFWSWTQSTSESWSTKGIDVEALWPCQVECCSQTGSLNVIWSTTRSPRRHLLSWSPAQWPQRLRRPSRICWPWSKAWLQPSPRLHLSLQTWTARSRWTLETHELKGHGRATTSTSRALGRRMLMECGDIATCAMSGWSIMCPGRALRAHRHRQWITPWSSRCDAQLQANSSHLQGHDGQDHSGTLITSTLKNPVPVEEVPLSTRKAKSSPKCHPCGGRYGMQMAESIEQWDPRALRPCRALLRSVLALSNRAPKPSRALRAKKSSMCQDSSMTKTPTNLSSAFMSKSMTKSVMASRKPLPNNIAMKMMQMVAVMTSTLTSVALDASLEGGDGLWEVACSENSWLTAAANEHGIQAADSTSLRAMTSTSLKRGCVSKKNVANGVPRRSGWAFLVPSFAHGPRSTTRLLNAKKFLKACDVVNAECCDGPQTFLWQLLTKIETLMCTGSGIILVAVGNKVLWWNLNKIYKNVALHGNSAASMDATMGS